MSEHLNSIYVVEVVVYLDELTVMMLIVNMFPFIESEEHVPMSDGEANDGNPGTCLETSV